MGACAFLLWYRRAPSTRGWLLVRIPGVASSCTQRPALPLPHPASRCLLTPSSPLLRPRTIHESAGAKAVPLYLTMIGLHLGLGLALKICECTGRGLPHLAVKQGMGGAIHWLLPNRGDPQEAACPPTAH